MTPIAPRRAQNPATRPKGMRHSDWEEARFIKNACLKSKRAGDAVQTRIARAAEALGFQQDGL